VNLILFYFLCFASSVNICDSSLDGAIQKAENLLLEDCKTLVDFKTVEVLTPQKRIDTIICKLRLLEADQSSFDYDNLVFTVVVMLCIFNIGTLYQKENNLNSPNYTDDVEFSSEKTTDLGSTTSVCCPDQDVAANLEVVSNTDKVTETEKNEDHNDKDLSVESPDLTKTVSFASDKPSEKSDDDNDMSLNQTKECDDEKVCEKLEDSSFFQDVELKDGEQNNKWVTVTRSRKSPRPQSLDLKKEVNDIEPCDMDLKLSTSHSSKRSVGECTPPVSPQLDNATKLTSLELTEEEMMQPGSTPHEFDLDITKEMMENILDKVATVETAATTEGAEVEIEQNQNEEENKTNELKPMVFVGGISASTSPMELVTALKAQGFKVVVVPRIRYGVSFGFCPDLVLSTEEEVQTLLAKGRVWVKDRWVDIRPYVPKDSTLPVPIAAPDSAMIDGVTSTPQFVPCTPSQFASMPFFHPVPSLGNYSSSGYIHPTAGYQPFFPSKYGDQPFFPNLNQFRPVLYSCYSTTNY